MDQVPTRPRVFLHIGTHKTGTTAIQIYATENRERLRQRGLLYPLRGCPQDAHMNYGHHLLAWSLTRDTSHLSEWAGLRQEIETEAMPGTVISSEDFCRITTAEQVQHLCKLLGQVDLRVVIYLRRQDQYIQALYCTDVMHYGQRCALDNYIAFNAANMDYRAVLEPWVAVLGAASVSVRPYERSQLRNGDVIEDFFSLVGLEGFEGLPRPASPPNQSYPLSAVGTLVRLRELGLKPDEMELATRLMRLLYRRGSSKLDYLRPTEALALAARYRESNAEIARQFLNRPDGDLFLDQGSEDDRPWLARYGHPDAALKVFLRDVMHRLRERA